jgi:glycosyltransferase involved in cell wall biosynthesis
MRALPDLLKERPKARVMIVGGSDVSYGARPPGGGSWRAVMTHEIRHKISDADWKRVHFLGKIPYPTYLQLLQLSSVHVYWTYPFVLSWSLLEAMSAACAVVASDTAPVREAVQHGVNGRLVDFFNGDQLVSETCRLLDNPAERLALGMAARNSAIERYDLKRICLPAQLAWADQLGKA